MSTRRDRHGRGLRGPVLKNSGASGFSFDKRFRMTPADRFTGAVDGAVERLTARTPRILDGIAVGIEDVPAVTETTTEIALAVATEATPQWPARIVLYRRPLEHRADTRQALEDLVYRTLSEQLAAMTGMELKSIAPDLDTDEE